MRYISLAGGSNCSDNENIYRGLPTEPPTTTTTTTTTTSTTSTTTEASTTIVVNHVDQAETLPLKDDPSSGTL